MLNGMALNLQNCRPRNLTETDHDIENQMPTHVIWGEVESVSQGNSSNDTTNFSGSQTCSDQGDEVKKKKLKNKRLNKVPYHNSEILSQSHDIQFRSSRSDKTTSSPHEEDENSARSLSTEEQLPQQQQTNLAGLSSEKKKKLKNTRLKNLPHDNRESDKATISPHEEDEVSDGNLSTEEPLPRQQQQQTHLASLSPDELQELCKKVPLNPRGERTSIGSIGHDTNCTPCLFVHSRVGCSNGILCDFCHFTHNRRSIPRMNKGRRQRYRRLLNRMEKVMVDSQDPQALDDDEPDPQALDSGEQARRQRGAKKQGGRKARSSDGFGHHAKYDGDASRGDCQGALGDMGYNADPTVLEMAMRSNVRVPVLDRSSQARLQLPQGFTHSGVSSQVRHNSLWHTSQEMPRYMNNAGMQPDIPPYMGFASI